MNNVNELISILVTYSALLATIVGGYAFLVNVITEVTKKWGILDKIPTAFQVYVTSLILTVVSMFVYIQYNKMAFVWYYIVGAIILSFFVSFVSIYGWEQMRALWNRFNANGGNKNE